MITNSLFEAAFGQFQQISKAHAAANLKEKKKLTANRGLTILFFLVIFRAT